MGFSTAAAIVLIGMSAIPGSAQAQTWPICFEDDGVPTAEAYAAFREAGRSFGEAGQFGARTRLSGPSNGAAWSENGTTAYVELLRAGVAASYLTLDSMEPLDDRCWSVTVERVEPARNPPALWHLRDIYGFAPGSVDMATPGARASVRIAAVIHRPGETRIRLDGHTDTVGRPDRNLELSRRRAEAVARALVREGVRWEDIDIDGHGETRLARPTADETPEPLNRRVEIDVHWSRATPD